MIIASTIFLKLVVSLRMKTRLSTLCEMRNTSTLWVENPGSHRNVSLGFKAPQGDISSGPRVSLKPDGSAAVLNTEQIPNHFVGKRPVTSQLSYSLKASTLYSRLSSSFMQPMTENKTQLGCTGGLHFQR